MLNNRIIHPFTTTTYIMPTLVETQRKERNLLFIDIETVSAHKDFSLLTERWQELWAKKAGYLRNEDKLSDADMYFDRAAIYAEFGRVIVIGLGFFLWENDQRHLKVKAIAGHNERELLLQFKRIIEKYNPKDLTLCAHNGKEFDYPYLCRRMLANDIDIPLSLQIANRKPWEINHLDTLEMWRFGDKKSYTSLELLAAVFNISSSKSDISGNEVNAVYYIDEDLERIQRYCVEDVVVLAQLYLKYQAEPLVETHNIQRV